MLVNLTIKQPDDRMIQICEEMKVDPFSLVPQKCLDGVYQASLNGFERSFEEGIEEDSYPYSFGKFDHIKGDMSAYLDEYHRVRRAFERKMRVMYSQKYKKNWKPIESLGMYGLCDTPEQLLEYHPHLADDDIKRVISITPIWRRDQSEFGGFRYHKWGQYIGKQKPRNEYIYDDKHIEFVCSFHIYRLTGQ